MTGRWVGSLLTVSLLLGMGSLAPRVEAETVLVQGRMSEREVDELLQQGFQQTQQGQSLQAIETLERTLEAARQGQYRELEAVALFGISRNYEQMGQRQQALESYKQVLILFRETNDRSWEATTLNNIGAVYDALGNRTKALDYLNQVLPITREVGDRTGEAATLNNISLVCHVLGRRTEALDYYNQALPITREVGDRPVEATTLSNLAAVYRDTNQPDKAITYWEDSLNILLELRGELQKDFRDTFVHTNRGPAIALVDLLIDQNQPQRAFEWANRVTTYELADYNRLIGVRVANPEAQAALDDWNDQSQQLQALRQQLQDNFSPALADQINDLQAQVSQQAETLAATYPEVAELFEIQPEDLSQLQASLPPGTVVLQPVLLTNIQNVPSTIALFLLSRDSLSVQKVPIDADEFNDWVTDYRQMLQSGDSAYRRVSFSLRVSGSIPSSRSFAKARSRSCRAKSRSANNSPGSLNNSPSG